ncbi:MAG: hypothetical protein IK018_01270 [Lachnospiraceae bacterium]|nr:hypothetical protein [Lachnospiraceae bacterium]
MKKGKIRIIAIIAVIALTILPVAYAIGKSNTCNHNYEWVADGQIQRQVGTHTERKPRAFGPGYNEYPCVMFQMHNIMRYKCTKCGTIATTDYAPDPYSPVIHTPAY